MAARKSGWYDWTFQKILHFFKNISFPKNSHCALFISPKCENPGITFRTRPVQTVRLFLSQINTIAHLQQAHRNRRHSCLLQKRPFLLPLTAFSLVTPPVLLLTLSKTKRTFCAITIQCQQTRIPQPTCLSAESLNICLKALIILNFFHTQFIKNISLHHEKLLKTKR